MSFNYDVSTSRGQVRRLIGDISQDAGILPKPSPQSPDATTNFDDAEIDQFLRMEDQHVRKAAALALETASAAWSAHTARYRLGPMSEHAMQAKAFAEAAKAIRMVYGHTQDETTAGYSVKAETKDPTP